MSTTMDSKWKYRGQNPIERLHEGEPYFFIRGQDSLSSEAVATYADLLKRESDKALAKGQHELSSLMLKQSIAVMQMASEFVDWQQDHRNLVKLPGTKP